MKFPLHWKYIGWWNEKRKTGKNCFAFIVIENILCAFKMFIIRSSMHFKAFSTTYHNLIVQPYWCASTLCYMRYAYHALEPKYPYQCKRYQKYNGFTTCSMKLVFVHLPYLYSNGFSLWLHLMYFNTYIGIGPMYGSHFHRSMYVNFEWYTLALTYVCAVRPYIYATYRQMRMRMIGCIFILSFYFYTWTVGRFKNK